MEYDTAVKMNYSYITVNEFQKHNTEQKKQVIGDSTYSKLKNRQVETLYGLGICANVVKL